MSFLGALRSAPRDPRFWWFTLAFVPCGLLLIPQWGLQPDLLASDYAQYVAHARALIEGRPYTDTGYVFSPYDRFFAPVAYPPGFPLLLAVAFAIFGAKMAVAKVVTLLLSLSLLALAGLYFTRERDWRSGVAVVLLLGLSEPVLEHSIGPITDLPFAALTWSVIVLADRDTTLNLRRVIGITFMTGVAVLFRPHGLILIPALAVWALLNARRLGWLTLIPAGALTLATVLGRLIVGPDSLRGFPQAARMVRNLLIPDLRYHHAVLDSHLFPFAENLTNDVFHVFTVAIMLVGLVEFVWRRPRSLAVVFGITYTLALASLQAVNVRFAFPLYPLFVFGLLNGLRISVGALFPGRGERAMLVYAAVLATVITVRGLTAEPRVPRREAPDHVELVEHLRGRVESGEALRVVSFRPRVLAWETGAPGMVLLRTDDREAHIAEWCRTSMTHVLLGGFGIGVRASAASRNAFDVRPGAFVTEFRNDMYELVRIDPVLARCGEAP